MTRNRKLRITKTNMEELKPPFLVLSEHQGFTDYYIAPLALFPHRASYVSDIEGFANFGDHLYQALGCIPTRRFIRNSTLIRNILHVTQKHKDIIVIYPEARHSNVGTNSTLQPSIGKLVRLLNIPVVVLKTHGSYLDAPIWDEPHRRKAPLSIQLELVLTPKQLRTASSDEITALLDRKLVYDEYRWQRENDIRISYPQRARGLHRVLYQCPHCRMEYSMTSNGATLCCTHCSKSWEMDEYGVLSAAEGKTEFSHIPDWYEFQRGEVHRQISCGTYGLDIEVAIDALPNVKGFVPMGKGRLLHNAEGFLLSVPSQGRELHFSPLSMPSVHTEYNYRGKGDCVVLSTGSCCYYLYPQTAQANITKIQLAGERFYELRHASCEKM